MIDDLAQGVTLALVHVDEHLIEVEAVVRAGDWQGRARAYTSREQLATAVTALQQFADGIAAEAELIVGEDTGVGLVAFRFSRIDRAGHIACHVRLASGGLAADHRPEEVARLSVEVRTDAWSVGQFARQLGEMARSRSGRAGLTIDVRARVF